MRELPLLLLAALRWLAVLLRTAHCALRPFAGGVGGRGAAECAAQCWRSTLPLLLR
jgi:hypothetical protein